MIVESAEQGVPSGAGATPCKSSGGGIFVAAGDLSLDALPRELSRSGLAR
jgi:hypothetical protein